MRMARSVDSGWGIGQAVGRESLPGGTWRKKPDFPGIHIAEKPRTYQFPGIGIAMKTLPLVSLFSLAAWFAPASCFATVVGTSIVEQPVNLGTKSDPTRIPLGGVGVISNHGYGIHRMIGEARACPDGAMRWEGGSELDQNLASVFGISVEAEDPTQISSFPVILRVKPWKPPGYSPYTKDQVLAATLWCLLRSAGGTPEQPLEIRVVAEGADDKPLEEKYSRKYVNRPGKDQKESPPVKVAGTVIEEDARGIAWVVFPDVARKEGFVSLTPGMIILEAGGDGDPGWHVLPVWGNEVDETDFLRLNGWSAAMCYSSYHSRGVREANSFLAGGGANGFEVARGEKSDAVALGFPSANQATLAANLLALVISAQPTEAWPLSVSIRLEESGLATYPAFRNAPDWKETHHNAHNITLECEFVWDAAAGKLTKGSVPLVTLDRNHWITLNPVAEPAADEASSLAATVRQRIKNGIHDGTLLAEKNMATDMLADSGLRRQIGLAGYYEALATFFDESKIAASPVENPVRPGNSEFDQLFRMGWTIGMNRGQAIAIEAGKEIEEAKLKKAE